MKITAGIIGASGYTGSELLRILSLHPNIEVKLATADTQAGQVISVLYPHLSTYASKCFQKFEDVQQEIKNCDLIFCGLPHCEAMKLLPSLSNKVVIDLGGDFRLSNAADYETWYGHVHANPSQLGHWVYGLPELFREKIRSASRIANPGCYPTASLLAIAPLVKQDLIEGTICIDALSGTSGAGRTLGAALHASHVLEDVRAYEVTKHQHTPEIEMAIGKFAGKEVKVSFTPHLVPIVRGIHATCSAQVKDGVKESQILDALKDAYQGEQFVRISKEPGGTKEVRASNSAVLSVYFDKRCRRAIITCVIDNLVKGAAGQAIQNANIILGLQENAGLQTIGLYP